MESGLPHFAVIYPDNISNPHGYQTWRVLLRELCTPLLLQPNAVSEKQLYILIQKDISWFNRFRYYFVYNYFLYVILSFGVKFCRMYSFQKSRPSVYGKK